ncbi:MAG TPA: ATP-binding cassette domain-containing protein [Opitutaceae bacterium]
MSSSRSTILTVKDLRVQRGEVFLLRDVAWQVERGEHWVILGPNGCGKTSLLKALTGYLSPTAGELSVLGQCYGASDWRDLRLHIGLVTSALQASIPPAEPALETVISGRYAQLDLWADTTAADARTARRWLREVDAEPLAERPWLYLSQGERQRVLIARALMARPRLLVLDEPCSGLDPVARAHFLRFIETLARRNGRRASAKGGGSGAPGLVLVTHHVEEIVPAFTHVLLLRAGRVVAAGPRDTVLTSANLSQTFAAKVTLRRRGGELRLVL